jgi:hypothetical protein
MEAALNYSNLQDLMMHNTVGLARDFSETPLGSQVQSRPCHPMDQVQFKTTKFTDPLLLLPCSAVLIPCSLD